MRERDLGFVTLLGNVECNACAIPFVSGLGVGEPAVYDLPLDSVRREYSDFLLGPMCAGHDISVFEYIT